MTSSVPDSSTSGRPSPHPLEGAQGIWKVITASSVGTMIEWYDFYIFGSLAAIISTQFFPGGSPQREYLGRGLQSRQSYGQLRDSGVMLGTST